VLALLVLALLVLALLAVGLASLEHLAFDAHLDVQPLPLLTISTSTRPLNPSPRVLRGTVLSAFAWSPP
jgi:hypothetical protein